MQENENSKSSNDRRIGSLTGNSDAVLADDLSQALRTPLMAMTGVLDLMSRSQLTAEQQNLMQLLQDSLLSLVSTVNNVLELAQVEQQEFRLENQVTSIYALAADCKSTLVQAASLGDASIDLNIDDGLPDVFADAERLRQVLLNLLAGSIERSQHPSVRLRVSRTKEKGENIGLRFAVSNAPGDHHKAQRAAGADIRRADTGSQLVSNLSLSVTRLLIEKMGGTIELRSHPQEGVTFSFELSFERAASSTKQEGNGQPSNGENSRQLHLLIVEDNPVLQRVLTKQLEHLGCTSSVVSNGLQALDVFKSTSFDLVLMDCFLPICDGFDATRAMRIFEGENGRKGTPILALTAATMSGDRERCLEAGMNDYLRKPVSVNQLDKKIREWTRLEQKQATTMQRNL